MVHNLSRDYLRINIAISILATFGIILRCWARWHCSIRYGLDDLLILIGWVFLVGLNVASGILYKASGYDGTPTIELSAQRITTVFKCFYAIQIMYYLCMLPTKLSILALYSRIFTPRAFRISIYVVAATCISWGIGGLLPTIFQCTPIEANWNNTVKGSCVNLGMLFSAITISNLLTDVAILVLPLFMIYKLQLSLRQKIAVSFIFLAGGAACICALIRIISSTKFGTEYIPLIIDCSLWITIEPALAIFSACLPCLKPLLPTHMMSKWYSSFASASQNSSTTSKKNRKSWFGIDLGHAIGSRRRQTSTSDGGLDKQQESILSKGADPCQHCEDFKNGHFAHVLTQKRQPEVYISGSLPIPPNRIYVRQDFEINAEALSE